MAGALPDEEGQTRQRRLRRGGEGGHGPCTTRGRPVGCRAWRCISGSSAAAAGRAYSPTPARAAHDYPRRPPHGTDARSVAAMDGHGSGRVGCVRAGGGEEGEEEDKVQSRSGRDGFRPMHPPERSPLGTSMERRRQGRASPTYRGTGWGAPSGRRDGHGRGGVGVPHPSASHPSHPCRCTSPTTRWGGGRGWRPACDRWGCRGGDVEVVMREGGRERRGGGSGTRACSSTLREVRAFHCGCR